MSMPRIPELLAYLRRTGLKEIFALPALALRVIGKSASLVSDSPASSKHWLFADQNLNILSQIEKSERAVEARKHSTIMAPGPSHYSKALNDILKAQTPGATEPIQVICKKHFLRGSSEGGKSINIVLSNGLFSDLESMDRFGGVPFFKLKVGKLNRDDALRFTVPLSRFYATIAVSSRCINKKHSSNYANLIKRLFMMELS